MSDLRQATVNCLLGVHIGDAFGVPFEVMTRAEILAAVGPAGVRGPRFDLDPKSRKVPDTRGLAPGSTSDDSQLANAVADGLIMAGRYHHELQTLLHLHELWNDVAGWGGTTKRSLYEVDKWYRERRKGFVPKPSFKLPKDERLWNEAVPRDPAHHARWHDQARGNGPAMKVAPLGMFYAINEGRCFELLIALQMITSMSRMTHADPICAVAAHAIAATIAEVAKCGPHSALESLRYNVQVAEHSLQFMHRGPDRFSTALDKALALAFKDLEALWAFGASGKSDALTSVPMALAIWWRHADDGEPTEAVLEAINAGGDTDTVASMVGAIMGASSAREDWWPADWVAALMDKGATANLLGRDLHDVASGASPPCGFDLDELKRKLGYA